MTDPASSSESRFNNPATAIQSWYAAVLSRNIKCGKARSFALLNRKIVIYRDDRGSVRALDARCPHLGADLGHGRVVGDGIQCAFHHWQIGSDGACRAAPGLAEVPKRRVRSYPVAERWGIIWIFNGPQPLFDLPGPPPDEPVWALRLPRRHIGCHPHLVIANGLDASHFSALHGIELTRPGSLATLDQFRVRLELGGRPRSSWARFFTGCRDRDLDAAFTTVGGNLAWLAVAAPLKFYVLFSGCASARGGCDTQTILFLFHRSPLRILQALACIYMILADDHRILDGLDFAPGFTDADAGLAQFARCVDAMEVW